jgi:hypothetical protein
MAFFLMDRTRASALDAAPEAGTTEATSSGESSPFLDGIQEAFMQGTVTFNLRARAEIADIDGAGKSQAYTERLRLGYGTKPFYGFKLFAEFEDTRSADDDLYNAAGLNGEPTKTVIADPENTELNQFFAQYTHDYAGARVGRQRIILDDARFVGNVGWRQNEQTYDAYTLSSSPIENLNLFYSYLDDINRIFGPDSGRDFESDSHLLNASYAIKCDDGADYGNITAFAYFLDFRNSDANSSNTLGLRYAGKAPISEDYSFGYALSYANQKDAADNATDYDAHYYSLEGSVARKGWGSLGAGYEVLDSDDRKGGRFRTPLATLHAFNGWADQFLVTPVAGLEDVYAFLGFALPYKIKGKIVYHWFYSEEGSSDYGEEFDVVASKTITKNFSVLGKIALYDGRKHSILEGSPQASNLQRYWIQGELKF